MSKRNDGGPAYPIPIAGCNDGSVYNTMEQSAGQLGGMTLRDAIAIEIIGQLAPRIAFDQDVENQLHIFGIETDDFKEFGAHIAYGFADAMLAERDRDGGS